MSLRFPFVPILFNPSAHYAIAFADIMAYVSTVETDKEKREVARFSISQMIELRFGEERWRIGYGSDLSEKGLRCRSPHQFSPGDSIYLLLSVGDHEQVTVEAVAIHSRPVGDGEYETGFAFTRFLENSKQTLMQYLQSLSDNQSSDAG